MAEKKSWASISALPEGIIHQILSRLNRKEAIRASLLSKTWLDAYQTKPILRFQNSDFSSKNSSKNMSTLSRYREQKIGIDSLEIHPENSRNKASVVLVDQWIQVAVENGVKSLRILEGFETLTIFEGVERLRIFRSSTPYVLPSIVFQSTSLEDLKVFHCELKLQETEKVKCQNLHCLQLLYAQFDDTIFEKIVSSCQRIETLDIRECTGFKNLKVTKLAKLKRCRFHSLVVKHNAKIEVESSTLEYFECNVDGSGDTDFEIDVLGRLTLHACPNLKSLALSGLSITDEFFFDFGCKFPRLEDLKISHCFFPQRIKISSGAITSIDLDRTKGLVEAEIEIPSLNRFACSGKPTPNIYFRCACGQLRGFSLAQM